MIINGEKWACETCIKGHRATHCTHAERTLLPIKRKGRPSTQCDNCKQLRVSRRLHVKCSCKDKNHFKVKTATDSTMEMRAKKRKTIDAVLRPIAPKVASPNTDNNSKNAVIPSPMASLSYNASPLLNNHLPHDSITSPIPSLLSILETTLPTPSDYNAAATPTANLFSPSASSNCSSASVISDTTNQAIASTNGPTAIKSSCCSNKQGTRSMTTVTTALTPVTSTSDIPTPSIETERPQASSSCCGGGKNRNHSPNSNASSSFTTPSSCPSASTSSPSPSISTVHTESVPLPNIPPPSSCCGPPSKNQQGEIIRVVTCRCGDSCACIGCDAHPAKIMKKDVYIGFNSHGGSSRDIDSSDNNNVAHPTSTEKATEPKHPTSVLDSEGNLLCGCGCTRRFEDCSNCFKELCDAYMNQ